MKLICRVSPTNPWVFLLKMIIVVPNKPMGFPTKNDQNLGCEIGVKETPISTWDRPAGSELVYCIYLNRTKTINLLIPGGETNPFMGKYLLRTSQKLHKDFFIPICCPRRVFCSWGFTGHDGL